MKKILITILVLVAFQAATAQVFYGADVGFKSKYAVRGAVYDRNPVVWPDVWVSYQEFTATVFANVPTKDLDQSGARSTEVDYMIDYKKTVDAITYGYGAYVYTFPGEASVTCAEVATSVMRDIWGHVVIGATGYMDARHFAYGYLSPSAKLYGTYKSVTGKLSSSVGLGPVGLQDVTSNLELSYIPEKFSHLTVTIDGHNSWMPV